MSRYSDNNHSDKDMSSNDGEMSDNESSRDGELKEIICHVYDSQFIDHDRDDSNFGSGLNLWCLDRDSNPIHLIIKDAPIYCYIELPTVVHGMPYHWDNDSVDLLHANWRKAARYVAPFMVELTERQKLYWFKDPTKPDKAKTLMVRAFFKSQANMAIFGSIIRKPKEYDDFGLLNFQYYEDKISIRRKVFSIRKTRYSQWFRVKGIEIPFDSEYRQAVKGPSGRGLDIQHEPKGRGVSKSSDHEITNVKGSDVVNKTSSRDIQEYLIENYDSIEPIPPEESMGWVTRPRILSWDIETYTNNHYALPDMNDEDHVVWMISCLYQETGRKETRKRYVIVLGECNPIENCEVISVKDEEDVILEFQKLVEELDPEIIMGYNIFGYDYPYIIGRQARMMMPWYQCSRLIGYEPQPFLPPDWKSSGYGHNKICYMQWPGRISIDLLPLIRRDFNHLDKYSLDFVANHFLGSNKHDVTPIQMFKAYESKDINEVTRVTRYCVQDSELVIDLYDKLNVWIGLFVMSGIVGVEIMELFTRGQQVRCVSQIYNATSQEDRKIVINSRLADPVPYEGGFVGTPIQGIHDNIICLDFASLYPSIMMAYNICYTTLVPKSPYFDRVVPDEWCWIIDVPATDKAPAQRHRFVKEEIFPGVLPQLVRALVNERKAVKKQIFDINVKLGIDNETGAIIDHKLYNSFSETERESMLISLKVLDKRQNGLKVSANSMYGFLGVQDGGKLPLIEGAASITASGRRLIGEVNQYLIDTYGATIVYNDTDSSMVSMPQVQDAKDCAVWGKKLAAEISAKFQAPLKLEYEKSMRILCLAKKMYAAYLIKEDGTFAMDPKKNVEKIMSKGIAIARRDKFGYMKIAYTKLLRAILEMKPIEDAFKIVIDSVLDVLVGDMPVRGNFTIIRGLGADYKADGFFMKVFSDELAKMGHAQRPGDRLEYVIVKSSDKKQLLGRRMRLIEMYEESQEFESKNPGKIRPKTMYPPEEIDREYYVTHGMQKSMDDLFFIGYKDVFDQTRLARRGYTPSSRLKFSSVRNPVKMITKILGDHHRRGFSMEKTVELIRSLPKWFRSELEYLQEYDSEDDRNVDEDDSEIDDTDAGFGIDPEYVDDLWKD